MGRQAYLNRLALGRSPYEAPEAGTIDPSNPVRRVSQIHSDNYMQQYDSRGHPVNPESKNLGRELRRAKNDILSTMGIVVSGEDQNANTSNEQQKINQIAAENDFGLVITTLDQIFVFFSTWWSSSLTGRILALKHYTHAPLLDVIRSERGSTGVFGFYCAGIPAWAVSSTLAIARDNPLKLVFATIRDYVLGLTGNGSLTLSIRASFGLLYSLARSSVLIFSIEAYMYSMLQTLSLVPSNTLPSLKFFIPFGGASLFRLPPLPSDFSISSIGGFFIQLLTSPGFLTYVYAFHLRPELEERIYRLIRRQLPKPTLADELSIRVAFEENLVEWVVPTLGRRSEEETRRAKLTLMQDIKQELISLRQWAFSLFGLLSSKTLNPQGPTPVDHEKLETLRNSIESLQQELEAARARRSRGLLGLDPDFVPDRSPVPEDHDIAGISSFDLPPLMESAEMSGTELDLGLTQVLTNENRMSQSPGEMSNDFFSEMATVGRTSAPSNASRSQSQPSVAQQGDESRNRHVSRSNTLFSRPSSPETSPPTSPRVRASLIHQSSDIITMQLELLGNRNRNPQNQAQVPRNPTLRPFARGHSALRPTSNVGDRRSIADFLEALILSQAQQQAAQQPSLEEPEDQSRVDTQTSQPEGQEILAVESQPPPLLQEAVETRVPDVEAAALEEHALPNVPNILPDGVEEPNDDDFSSLPPLMETSELDDIPPNPTLPPISQARQNLSSTDQPSIAHRVTLLSAHPVDSLASHLASVITTIILTPLESLYIRSLAHSFLSIHPSSAARVSGLHPVGLWFGGNTWTDAFAYCGRVFLMRGMQAALRAGVWGFLVGSTMRIGRKFCGWGTL
ncbi:uncharacterized protein N7483_007045 [Penicillium malachiteum]|uniref:uncharacterized protein n=1 Tax=Penicillium malachiteum TaxID=1324776 RepID=UPI002548BBF0|nr:uncharacterized protein N7483_007045 [Penicillium malachiteum]KAJ5725688.1 hypothetical protein N7483_007045 [Penicillium malachiteum]